MAGSTSSSAGSNVPSPRTSSSTSPIATGPVTTTATTTAAYRPRTAQHKRRSHKKSRHGCGSCKRFHVKCDESGPPCGNCVLRQAPCIYPLTKTARVGPVALAKAVGGDSGSGNGSTSSSSSSSSSGGGGGGGSGSSNSGGEGWAAVAAPSRGLLPGGGDDERRLELELMHRWSVRTYAGFVSIADDVHYASMVVPRAALEHDAMLAGILTCAALDLALSAPDAARELAYARHAMRQYARASAALGAASRCITPANHHVLVYLGVMLILYHIAFTQIGHRRRSSSSSSSRRPGAAREPPTILPQLGGIFSLVCSNAALARRHWDWIWNSPFPMHSHLRQAADRAPLDALDPAVRAACARLHALNVRLHGGGGGGRPADPAPSRPAHDPIRRGSHPADAAPLEAAAEATVFSLPMTAAAAAAAGVAPEAGAGAEAATRLFYRNAVAVLESLFAEEARGALKGGCLAFPAMARKYPTAGVRRSEPMELLLLMHWGVLLQMEAAYYWWVGQSGRMLVAECCDALGKTGLFELEPDCIASVAWARRQVGLPDVSVPSLVLP